MKTNQKAIDEVTNAVQKRRDDLRNYLSTSEVGRATGKNNKTVRRAIRAGQLKAKNIGTKERPEYRIHKDEAKKWMRVA